MGTLAQVAEDTGGRLHGTDQPYLAICTDTRTISPGDLFFALRGASYDANSFIADALSRGAAGAVVERKSSVDLAQVEVSDAQRALGEVAHEWRKRFSLPLVGITGSNGKTTIKELTAAILRAGSDSASVLATKGNRNNEVGLPLTLLQLSEQHQAAVIEMGAGRPGDIAILATIAEPNVVVISNAARAHLLGFGSVAAVAATKGEILDGLTANSTAVLNHDDPFFADWAQRAQPAKVSSFGLSSAADYYAENIRTVDTEGQIGFEFDMVTPLGSVALELPLAGQHNILNALAASAAAIAAGADLAAVCAGLANSRNVPGRLRKISLLNGPVIYDDSYNANPDSVAAAIRFLTSLKGDAWLVLGDMGELGADAEQLHFGIGELAKQSGITALLCTGELSQAAVRGFGAGAQWFESLDELHAALLTELQAGRNILIKASRFMGLDELVRRIESEAGG
jgi:UDP-N-acetylmuramoyl-tripeptide--D-alanyl-D-alanine ligase